MTWPTGRTSPRTCGSITSAGIRSSKKWLSYREQGIARRALRAEEAREVTGMARRLARIVLLQPILDANYKLAKSHAYPWPKAAE